MELPEKRSVLIVGPSCSEAMAESHAWVWAVAIKSVQPCNQTQLSALAWAIFAARQSTARLQESAACRQGKPLAPTNLICDHIQDKLIVSSGISKMNYRQGEAV